jgi:hypothetical protein
LYNIPLLQGVVKRYPPLNYSLKERKKVLSEDKIVISS